MGGSEAPYLYPSPERRVAYPYSNFNPRAATQASYQALHDHDRTRPRQEGPLLNFDRPDTSGTRKRTGPGSDGPLVNFNQHPDSWTIVAGHTVSYTPMPENTKTKVKALRWTQFIFRVIGGIGAAGMLAAMIILRDMPNVFAWIMRIVPAWDIIVTLYAIYHLYRPATARTPGSTASYHTFAAFMDLALLPFYVYTSLEAQKNYVAPANDPAGRWTSLLGNLHETTTLLDATFIGAAVVAGLHLLCAMLDVWLIVLFKNIASLPPDVNPLEDNLTSRAPRTSKHKYKNSELTLSGEAWSEKKEDLYSASSLSLDAPVYESTKSRDVDEADSRKIPFNHSRIKSNNAFSPHNPRTALLAQQHFEEVQLYKQPESGRNSRLDSPSRRFDTQLSRHAGSPHPNEVIPMPPSLRDRSLRPNSSANSSMEMDVTDCARIASPALPNAAPLPAAVQSQQKENLMDDNWYVIDDDTSTVTSATGDRPNSSHGRVDQYGLLAPQPLKMNPPTPPPPGAEFPDPEDDTPAVKRKPLAVRSDKGNGEGERKLTFQVQEVSAEDSDWNGSVRGGTPKRKYYGDLAAATRGVLGTTKSKPTVGASRILSTETTKSTGTVDAAAMDSTGMSALSTYGYGRIPSRQYNKRDGKGRVVSRTGVDIVEMADEGHFTGGFGIRGRRDVSGKVAEEGRGGNWWSRKR